MSIRAFLALEISDEARKGIAKLRDPLEKGIMFTDAHPSWVRPESMHLTIKFLGNIEEKMVPRIAARLKPACAALAPFDYGVRGLGVFPSPKRPRVVWIGIKKADEELQRLHETIERELSPLGQERDLRAFHPHLTLARMKSTRGAKALMEILARHGRQWCGDSRAERLILFQSQLNPEGATYTPLATFPFLGKP